MPIIKATLNLIIFFFIINENLVSQTLVNNLFDLKRQIILEDLSKEPLSDSRAIATGYWKKIQYYNNDLYIMNLDKIENDKKIGRHFKLYIFSKNKNKILKVPTIKRNIIQDDYYNCFAVSEKYLCILAQFYVYIYSIENDNVNFIRKISLDYYHHLIKLEGDKIIIMMSNIVSETIKVGNHTNILIYDIVKDKTISKGSLPNPNGIEQSFFMPSNFITYQNGIFAVSDVTKYQIHLYDTKLNLLETLSRTPNIWKDIKYCKECQETMKTLNLKSFEVHETIKKLNKINMLFSTVRRVNFINDTTLFVCIENMAKDYFDSDWYYDVWKKRNGKWQLENTELKVKNNLNTTILKFDCFSASYIISDGKLLTTGAIPFLIKNEEYKNHSAVKERIDNYFIDNPLKYSVFVYEIKD